MEEQQSSNGARPAGPAWKRLIVPLNVSAGGLALRGVLLVAAFLAAHLSGLRIYTTVLSGTSPTGAPIDQLSLTLGGLYLMLWFGCVLAAPVLLLASGLMWMWQRRATGDLEVLRQSKEPPVEKQYE